MKPNEFLEIVNKESDFDYGLCPSPIKAEKGLDILITHFLGKDWYVSMSMNTEQMYTEAIYQILEQNQKKPCGCKKYIVSLFYKLIKGI
jgi:hypothetical protein